MKKLLLILLCLPMIGFGQNVNIPDANFKAYLVGNSAINTNGDTEIQVSEAIVFNGTIDCNNLNISDLTGIADFTALTELFCYSNQLSSLNLSNNTQLFEVSCGSNQLTYIDLRNGNNSGLWYFQSMNNPGLNCIDVDDVAYCEYNFAVDSWTSFSNNCFPTNISGVTNNKKLIRVIDIHGRIISPKPNIPLIYIYSDGSREKRIFIQ